MLTTVYLLVAMLIVKGITFFVSIGFILLYTLYVIIVVCQSKNLENEEEEEVAQDAMKFAEIAKLKR